MREGDADAESRAHLSGRAERRVTSRRGRSRHAPLLVGAVEEVPPRLSPGRTHGPRSSSRRARVERVSRVDGARGGVAPLADPPSFPSPAVHRDSADFRASRQSVIQRKFFCRACQTMNIRPFRLKGTSRFPDRYLRSMSPSSFVPMARSLRRHFALAPGTLSRQLRLSGRSTESRARAVRDRLDRCARPTPSVPRPPPGIPPGTPSATPPGRRLRSAWRRSPPRIPRSAPTPPTRSSTSPPAAPRPASAAPPGPSRWSPPALSSPSSPSSSRSAATATTA